MTEQEQQEAYDLICRFQESMNDGICGDNWISNRAERWLTSFEKTKSAKQKEEAMTNEAINESSTTDFVDHPPHYTAGKIECIDAIQSALTPDEYRGYIKGNVMKYVWRERYKGGGESLAKAEWYLQRATQQIPA